MSSITIPEDYQSLLGLYDTQKAIGLIKTIFQEKLCMALHLKRVTAPLFVMQGSGLNDDLNGVERPVAFDVPSLNEQAEIVHSLAKALCAVQVRLPPRSGHCDGYERCPPR